MPVRIVLSMGDPAGIGPEVLLLALRKLKLQRRACPVVVGVPEVLASTARRLGVEWNPRVCRSPADLEAMGDGSWSIWPIALPRSVDSIPPGKPRSRRLAATCGDVSYRAVVEAVRLVQGGHADALVTAPIAKEHWHAAGHAAPGHTELLAALAGHVPVCMMMAGSRLRVVLMTTHVPLRDVPRRVTASRVVETVNITDRALRQQFGLRRPRLAVAGINPHAGEGGLFGDEDERIVRPAVQKSRRTGVDVVGPLPADALFYHAAQGMYDAVIAPYHDQALAPFKLLHFRDGVNVTLGLPWIRTSPDHGTAFDIAGKGVADATSMAAAITLAVQLAQAQRAKRKTR